MTVFVVVLQNDRVTAVTQQRMFDRNTKHTHIGLSNGRSQQLCWQITAVGEVQQRHNALQAHSFFALTQPYKNSMLSLILCALHLILQLADTTKVSRAAFKPWEPRPLFGVLTVVLRPYDDR